MLIQMGSGAGQYKVLNRGNLVPQRDSDCRTASIKSALISKEKRNENAGINAQPGRPGTRTSYMYATRPQQMPIKFPHPPAKYDQTIVSTFRRAHTCTEKVEGNRSPIDHAHAHMETGPNSSLRKQVYSKRSYNRTIPRRLDDYSSLWQVRETGEAFRSNISTTKTLKITENTRTLLNRKGTGSGEKAGKAYFASLDRHLPRQPLLTDDRLNSGEKVTQTIGAGVDRTHSPLVKGLYSDFLATAEVTIPCGPDYTNLEDMPSETRDKVEWRPARRLPIDGGMDHGVSNTSQYLLETKLRKHTLSFPEISIEEQRRALGSPRMESPRLTRSRPPSNKSPVRQSLEKLKSSKVGMSDKIGNNKERPNLEGNIVIDCPNIEAHGTASSTEESKVEVPEQISYPRPEKIRTEMYGSLVSIESDSTKKSSPIAMNSKDRYSKMTTLGITRVNLDIKTHFYRQTTKRRTQKSRGRLDIPSKESSPVKPPVILGISRSEHPAREQVEYIHVGQPAHSQPPPSISKSTMEGADEDTDLMWPGDVGDMHVESVITHTHDSQSINQSYINGASLRSSELPFTSVRTDLKNNLKDSLSVNLHNNTHQDKRRPINYTYFRMMPPGQMNISGIRCAGASNVQLYQGAG